MNSHEVFTIHSKVVSQAFTRFFRIAFLGSSLLAILSSPLTAQETDEAIKINIKPAAFQEFAEIALEEFLQDLNTFDVDDQSTTIPLILRAKMKDVSVDLQISSLTVTPKDGAIEINTELDQFALKIGSMGIENYFFPKIHTTCTNTVIKFGDGHPISIDALFAPTVENEELSLESRRFDFELDRDQYHTSGPDDCVGPFDMDFEILAKLTKFIISKSRRMIRWALRTQMDKIINVVNDKLESVIDNDYLLQIPSLVVLPATDLMLGVSPSSLEISEDSLDAKINVRLKRASEKDFNSEKRHSFSDVSHLLASLGIKGSLLNAISRALLIDGTTPIEITSDMHEMLGMVLKKEEMAEFWPDLATIETDTSEIRISAELKSPPTIAIDQEDKQIKIDAQDIYLTFKVLQDEQWKDYHTVILRMQGGISPRIENLAFQLDIFPGEAEAQGFWPEDYSPTDPTFNKEEFTFIMVALLEMVQESDFINIPLPVLPYGMELISFDNLKVEGDFINLDVISYKEQD